MSILPSSYREADARHRLILALDLPCADDALRLVHTLGRDLRWVKVGMELFTAEGPSIVRHLNDEGYRVFLDLKFHDIPHTMAKAVVSAARLGARMCTVHAMAGKGVGAASGAVAKAKNTPAETNDNAAMAKNTAAEFGDLVPPAVLAVTVLTSHGEGELEKLLDTPLSTPQLVSRLAKAAVREGATGLVASPREIGTLRAAVGKEPLLVIPGIRPAGSEQGDQSRVATPGAALKQGADFLVVGRPITRAADPRGALGRILDEMAAAV